MDRILFEYTPHVLDSDDESEAEGRDMMVMVADYLNARNIVDRRSRNKRVEYVRLDMKAFLRQYINDPSFDSTIRMNRRTFNLLVSLLEPSLLVNEEMASKRGGAITPSMCVYLTLRYLAGGSHHDLKSHLGISKASFYRCLDKTKLAICNCPALDITFPTSQHELRIISNGFEAVSTNQSICNCVGAVDGYLLSINTPPASEVGNVKSYFSGHYQKYGMNIQAVCDSSCMFLYFAISGAGSINDRVAIHHMIDGISLYQRIDRLPGKYVVIADAAYQPTEHLVPIFYGTQRENREHDNFNYVASQCRIRIEMAFGIMQAKWRILRRPLEATVPSIHLIVKAISRLHNFVIKEQHDCVYQSIREAVQPDRYDPAVPNVLNDPQFPIPPPQQLDLYATYQASTIRDAMVQRVRASGAVRQVPNMVDRNIE
jgi:hypothetical protein